MRVCVCEGHGDYGHGASNTQPATDGTRWAAAQWHHAVNAARGCSLTLLWTAPLHSTLTAQHRINPRPRPPHTTPYHNTPHSHIFSSPLLSSPLLSSPLTTHSLIPPLSPSPPFHFPTSLPSRSSLPLPLSPPCLVCRSWYVWLCALPPPSSCLSTVRRPLCATAPPPRSVSAHTCIAVHSEQPIPALAQRQPRTPCRRATRAHSLSVSGVVRCVALTD